ncbi:hypothetical protein HDV05_002306 [Chytridiales sp. JEL 0842]|nr:hypothetical protein HDV05_002306 [Chytridiales sp. JEL 0842]
MPYTDQDDGTVVELSKGFFESYEIVPDIVPDSENKLLVYAFVTAFGAASNFWLNHREQFFDHWSNLSKGDRRKFLQALIPPEGEALVKRNEELSRKGLLPLDTDNAGLKAINDEMLRLLDIESLILGDSPEELAYLSASGKDNMVDCFERHLCGNSLGHVARRLVVGYRNDKDYMRKLFGRTGRPLIESGTECLAIVGITSTGPPDKQLSFGTVFKIRSDKKLKREMIELRRLNNLGYLCPLEEFRVHYTRLALAYRFLLKVADLYRATILNKAEICKTVCDGLGGCLVCNVKGKKLKACSICRLVYYCGVDCQKAHWSEHKKVCASWEGRPALTIDDVDLVAYELSVVFRSRLELSKINRYRRV